MSKPGVNTTPNKQDSTQFKKENRTPNPTAQKDDNKRQSTDSFTNQGGRSHHNQQQHGNQHHNQNQNRDRSGNRNDNHSHQYDRNAPETKSNDKDDKSLAEPGTAAPEKKFTGRCRLFVGNLTPDVTEDEFRKMFEPFGEVSEMYVNTSRGFGFIRLDYRQNAEAAKAALDGHQRKGRVLRVRFASHGAALKVKNLHPYVSNELLEQSFSQFGDLERCVVIVDDRGKPTGEGIVEFVRKPGANSALRRITEGVFLMGAEPKPIAVEPLEQKDEEDGLPEKFLTRTDPYKKEREKEPRFAPPGTFEYEFGMRWKQIEDIEKQRIEQVKKDTEEARLKLEDEMQNALYEYQAEQIRQDLRRQQEELLRLEELRNQDRMRRQQEHEIRRQQEERERAQQEERRRADTMMLMRQHEMARGRGPMDIPGMRGRDEMMMVDRYGDRMGERMGDRMPERMGDRMPDRMGGDRMPDRMGGDRMPDRMGGDRMPDRMGGGGDRMPDRMGGGGGGDRMPDRMGDRMGGPGQPGFMWDDKQRGEAGMRGDAGRGRGSGAPPLQPPPVPPSSVNLERGGPGPIAAATAGGAAQGRKSSSPKPLMQASGFGGGGPGAPPGSGPSSNTQQNSADASAGGEDWNDETECWIHETEETDSSEETSDYSDVPETRPLTSWPATFHSPKIHGEEASPEAFNSCRCNEDCQCHLAIDETCVDEFTDLLADKDCAVDNNVKVNENSAHSSSTNLKTYRNVADDCSDEDLCANDLNHSDVDLKSKILINQSSMSASLVGDEIEASSYRCQSVNRCKLSPPAQSDNLDKSMGIELTPMKSRVRDVSCPDNCVEHNCSQNISGHAETMASFTNNTEENNPANVLCNIFECNATCENLGQTDETIKDTVISSHQCLSLSGSSRYCTSVGPENSCLSVGGSQNMQSEDNQASVTSQFQQLSVRSGLSVQHSHLGDQYESSQVSEGYNSSSESSVCNSFHVSRIDSGKSKNRTCNASNKTHSEKCKHSIGKRVLKGLPATKKSFRKQRTDSKDGRLSCRKTHCNKDVLSYEQYQNSNTEDINNEAFAEDDVPSGCVDTESYHSQEGDCLPLHYQTTGRVKPVSLSAVSQYGPFDGQASEWQSGVSFHEGVSSGTLFNSQIPNSESFTASETQAFDSSSDDQEMASTCSSVASSHPSERNLEAGLCTDDQTYQSLAARQPVVVTCMPAGCSIPYMSDMNCSMYGTAVVQAMGRPVVMSSPPIHFARRRRTATMMQHQNMSGRSMAHANVMKHQALSNGMQATAVLQHHSLTNGGQTMYVQQRTMMTGLGGLAQQTVIQQQVAAPAALTQSTMMHVSAVRQRALTPQQASLIQQRGLRYVPTGVLGAPLLQSQTIQSTAMIEGRTAALMGHGLVSGVNQSHVMQHLVQQRYLGGPIMPARGVQLVAGHPVRLVNK